MFKHVAWTAIAFAGLATAAFGQQTQPLRHAYDVTPAAGPWMICVNCFIENIDLPPDRDFTPAELSQRLAQSQSRKLAIDFVTLLRSKYGLPAYMFNRGDEERRKEEERVAKERRDLELAYQQLHIPIPRKVPVKRVMHIQDQYIVLVGEYPNKGVFREQEAARRMLDTIRKLPPPEETRFMNRMAAMDNRQTQNGWVNPFQTAMVVPNPTVKVEKPKADKGEAVFSLDEMNAHNSFSPLKHAGKWTLLIKEYKVPNPLYGRNDQLRADPGESGRMFEAVSRQSESLAALLRNPPFSFETYVLHGTFGSYVTVGIFDSAEDPRLTTMRTRLGGFRLADARGVDVEQLMNPAMPFQIPKGHWDKPR